MFCGLVAVKKGRKELHKYLMLAAVGSSAIFLGLYLIYHFNVPSKTYTGEWGSIYYPILITHILLAIFVPFMVGFILLKAFKGEFQKHKKFARITFPIWAYVSITGIVVYLMVT